MWHPQYKDELVKALASVYPQERTKFQRMTKAQLQAIFYRLRRERRMFS
jgi:hypothetical protein